MQMFDINRWLTHSQNRPREENPFFEIYDHLPPILHEAFLVGGSVRALVENRKPTTDWDFFFPGENEYTQTLYRLIADGWNKKSENQFNVTLTGIVNNQEIKVQLIKVAYYPSMQETLDSFDFTICQFGYYTDQLYAGEFSLWDLARKRLAVNRITYAASSVKRLLKYSSQGFTVCQGCATSLLNEVARNPAIINSEVEYID